MVRSSPPRGAVCWGVNELGELGDGTGLGRRTPVAVKGLSRGVASVSVGIYHGCARNDAGGVRCWGSNSQGQLGHGRSDVSLSPVAVDGLPA